MKTSYAIREAGPADAGDLARLAERTFRVTFEDQNTAEDMDLHCAVSYGEPLQAAEIADPAIDTLVVEADGGLVAYAQLRRGAPPDCVEAAAPAEIYRFYVDREWHGRGVARDLMREALRRIGERDADAVWLGVWEHNPRAIAFYRKWGFVEVGDHPYPVGNDPQRDLILVLELPASPQETEGRSVPFTKSPTGGETCRSS